MEVPKDGITNMTPTFQITMKPRLNNCNYDSFIKFLFHISHVTIIRFNLPCWVFLIIIHSVKTFGPKILESVWKESSDFSLLTHLCMIEKVIFLWRRWFLDALNSFSSHINCCRRVLASRCASIMNPITDYEDWKEHEHTFMSIDWLQSHAMLTSRITLMTTNYRLRHLTFYVLYCAWIFHLNCLLRSLTQLFNDVTRRRLSLSLSLSRSFPVLLRHENSMRWHKMSFSRCN